MLVSIGCTIWNRAIAASGTETKSTAFLLVISFIGLKH